MMEMSKLSLQKNGEIEKAGEIAKPYEIIDPENLLKLWIEEGSFDKAKIEAFILKMQLTDKQLERIIKMYLKKEDLSTAVEVAKLIKDPNLRIKKLKKILESAIIQNNCRLASKVAQLLCRENKKLT